MKILHNIWLIATLMMLSMTLSGCEQDDSVTSEDLKTYVIGTWRSHHVTVYTTDGRENIVNVTKNNAYSSLYVEMTFQKDGKVISEYWQQNSNGSSSWKRDVDSYTINGDNIIIKEDADNGFNNGLTFNTDLGGGSTRSSVNELALTIDRSNGMLYTRVSENVHGVQITANLYFKK